VAPSWIPANGQERRVYDLIVICYRDALSELPLADARLALSSVVAEASRTAEYVLLATPPPMAEVDLTHWEATDTDYYDVGFWDVWLDVARSYGVPLYEANAAFRALVTGGSRTVAQLMADAYHPSFGDAASDGIQQYVDNIVSFLGAYQSSQQPRFGPHFHVRLLGKETIGTWPLVYAENMAEDESAYAIIGAPHGRPLSDSVRGGWPCSTDIQRPRNITWACWDLPGWGRKCVCGNRWWDSSYGGFHGCASDAEKICRLSSNLGRSA